MPEETPQNENVDTENIGDAEMSDSEGTAKAAPVVFRPELLNLYYARLFPFELMHKWLSYEGSPATKSTNNSVFGRREFSFTIQLPTNEEVYLRYRSFRNAQELADAIRDKKPIKIDIGAVFSHPPKDKGSLAESAFHTVQRELVFDIDLTDYDGVRCCGCQGASICPRCWKFMDMAQKVLDTSLREDFGFQHIAWFYSGRRGIHAWVCDESARNLTNEARSAVASYLEISLGNDKNKNMALPTPIHPMMHRAFEVLEPLFIEYVLPESGHGLLASNERCQEILKTIPATIVREKVSKSWDSHQFSPQENWEELKKHIQSYLRTQGKTKKQKTSSNDERTRMEHWTKETVFRYTYPRLDINVSKMQNHLLKSPFCVHPKTGRVCVYMPSNETFDPFQVPTLDILMKDLDDYQGDEQVNWKKTSLKRYFDAFQNEFLDPLLKEVRRKERDEAEERAAMVGDF